MKGVISMAYQTINPYTNEVIKTYDNMTDEQVKHALAQAHERLPSMATRREFNPKKNATSSGS